MNKLQKHSVSKIVLNFHFSNKLFWWSQHFFKLSDFSLELQKFFSVTRTIFFLKEGQVNFGNKIPFLFDLIGWAWRMWGLSWGSWNNFQPFERRLSWFHHQSLWSWNLPIWRTSRRLCWSSQHLVASYCQNHL